MTELSSWVADMAKKHGFDPPSGGGGSGGPAAAGGGAHGAGATATAEAGGGAGGSAATPAASGGPVAAGAAGGGGSGAQGQADAAEAAAAKVAPIVSRVQALQAEVQTSVQEAQKHKTEAQTAKTAVDQAAQGIAAPPPVSAPQGADPKTKYDASIQISGNARRAEQDAQAKAADAGNQKTAVGTAVIQVNAKVAAAQTKATEAETQAAAAKAHVEAASRAAQGAQAEAAKSKAAADQTAQDDPNKAALQQAAQKDAQHAARAKAAVGKAQTAARQAEAGAKSAQTQAKSAEAAKQAVEQAKEAVNQSVSGLDAKLVPYGEAVTQAEAQEAECKANAGDDAQSVLEKRYEELGGDDELRQVLAAEDREFQALVERFRAKAKDWQKDRNRELDEQKTKLESLQKKGAELIPKTEAWSERESSTFDSTSQRANALGEKLQTEPGKEMQHELTQHGALIGKAQAWVVRNQGALELIEKNLELLYDRQLSLEQTYEAAEKFIQTMSTELDNELQMSAMSLEQKVDFLQAKPKPVRDRIEKQAEARLQEMRKQTTAETMAETPKFEEDAEFGMTPIDWSSVQAKLSDLESKSLEELQGKDPREVAMEEEYQAAGGDKALFDKRVAEWKKKVEEHHRLEEAHRKKYEKEAAALKEQATEAADNLELTRGQVAGMESELREARAERERLLGKVDPVTMAGLSPQEAARVKLLARQIARLETEIAARKAMLPPQQASKQQAEKLRDVRKQRYEAAVDDDALPLPERPESAEVSGLPLKVKYEELLGKPAPA